MFKGLSCINFKGSEAISLRHGTYPSSSLFLSLILSRVWPAQPPAPHRRGWAHSSLCSHAFTWAWNTSVCSLVVLTSLCLCDSTQILLTQEFSTVFIFANSLSEIVCRPQWAFGPFLRMQPSREPPQFKSWRLNAWVQILFLSLS